MQNRYYLSSGTLVTIQQKVSNTLQILRKTAFFPGLILVLATINKKIFVKLCLHLSYKVPNSLYLDEFFCRNFKITIFHGLVKAFFELFSFPNHLLYKQKKKKKSHEKFVKICLHLYCSSFNLTNYFREPSKL